MAAIFASTRSNNACVCSCLYPFSAGDTENPITFSVFIPRSTCIRFTRLFRNSPVGTSSTADTITCAHTSSFRTRAAPVVPELWPDSFFNVTAAEARAASHAGYSPNNSPVTTESPSPNSSTGHSSRASRKWIGVSPRQAHDQQLERDHREGETRDTACRRQHQRFGQHLPHQFAASRAHRGANRHLPPPLRRARQQQVRGVGHRDQQHQHARGT